MCATQTSARTERGSWPHESTRRCRDMGQASALRIRYIPHCLRKEYRGLLLNRILIQGLKRGISELAVMKKLLLTSIHRWLVPVVLAWLCSSASLPDCRANEVRYRVIKIIEGSGTSVPEAGGINQKGEVVGSIDVRGSPNFWLWSDGVRQDL